MTIETSPVLVERSADGTVGELVLNRPGNRNGLSAVVARTLNAGLQELVEDTVVKVILLRGGGGYLCGGLDLKEFERLREAGGGDGGWPEQWHAFHLAMHRCPKPTICVLEGTARGAGCALALSADYLVVAQDSAFHVVETNIGMIAVVIILLMHAKYGAGVANEMCVNARVYTGEECSRKGIAQAIAPTGPEAVALGRRMAVRLTKNEGRAMKLTKDMVRSLSNKYAVDIESGLADIFANYWRNANGHDGALPTMKSATANIANAKL